MTERGYVRFDTALNGTLEAEEAPLPANLRDASGLDDGALSNLVTAPATASRAVVSDADGKLTTSAATATEVGYLSGVTSALQMQINAKAPLASPTFTGTPAAPTAAAATNTTQVATTAFVVAEIAAAPHAATSKTTPVDADEIPLIDTEASNVLKKLTWANLKATAKTYFDTLYQPLNTYLSAIAALSRTDGNIIVGDGTTWVAESGATARTSLGVGTGDSPQFTGIELGHATDTTITRASAGVIAVEGSNVLLASNIGVSVQAYDADTAKLDVEDQTVTGGATVTSKSLGTVSSGTTTLDMGDRPLQHYTNNGAHTLAPGTPTGSILLDITNGASAGAITTSGFTKVSGDSFTTTSGHKFRCAVSVGNGGSLLQVQALQ